MAIAVGKYTEYSNGTQKSLYRIGIVISIGILALVVNTKCMLICKMMQNLKPVSSLRLGLIHIR